MELQATLALREKMAQLLAADTATLAPATANKLALFQNDATPNEGMTIADFTLADFDGSTPIAGVTGAQLEGLDPNNTDAIISIKPPASGYRWETTGVTNLPQTIYGAVLIDDTGATVLGAVRFTEAIELTAANQVIEVGPVQFRQQANSVS